MLNELVTNKVGVNIGNGTWQQPNSTESLAARRPSSEWKMYRVKEVITAVYFMIEGGGEEGMGANPQAFDCPCSAASASKEVRKGSSSAYTGD